jgi:hypothetical protein
MKRFTSRSFFLVALCLGLLLAWPAGGGGAQSMKDKKAREGTPVIWREPADIATRDLFLGPGGEAMKPDMSKITFIEDRPGGYSIKYLVRDGAGRKWVTKRREEAQPETAATRLVWAVGYYTDITYFARSVLIGGKGMFFNVRFEARPEGVKRLDPWAWDKNPFVGTRELQGLKVLMVLMNNWDLKDSNNQVLFTRDEQTGEGELRYIVSDLGATFGKTGGPASHTRNVPSDYAKTKFVTGVENGFVRFDYHGKNGGILRDITVEQAKWIGGLLSRLSDKQIKDAFRAGGYSPEEVEMLAGTVRARINELTRL